MNREDIYKALYAKLNAKSITYGGLFKTVTRRPILWNEIKPTELPALVIIQEGDTYVYQSENTPPKVTLNTTLLIYTKASQEKAYIPATLMNNLKDSIDDALKADYTGKQTLGGLVSHCRVEGDCPLEDGSLDGTGVAVVRVKMLVA